MLFTNIHQKLIVAMVTILAVVCLTVVGCRSVAETAETAAATPPPHATTAGADAWANNCMRCHNMRFPPSYSDAQWDVALHHMRVRGNLLASEHEAIVRYLKSAN